MFEWAKFIWNKKHPQLNNLWELDTSDVIRLDENEQF